VSFEVIAFFAAARAAPQTINQTISLNINCNLMNDLQTAGKPGAGGICLPNSRGLGLYSSGERTCRF
jgi:hypothetical protein